MQLAVASRFARGVLPNSKDMFMKRLQLSSIQCSISAVVCLALLGFCVPTIITSRTGGSAASTEIQALRDRYLSTMKGSLTGVLLQTAAFIPSAEESKLVVTKKPFSLPIRDAGIDWPEFGLTMAGTRRLENVEQLILDVEKQGIPGDFVECGVWRGGSSIYAKAVMQAYGMQNRRVHLVDSFSGLPRATTGADSMIWSTMDYLRVSEEEVKANFKLHNLLDSDVIFHKGFFRYSLPAWRAVDKSTIAVLRMDGDMYESTMDILYTLWDAVAMGGWIIIDDYAEILACKTAVTEFLNRHKIKANFIVVPGQTSAWYFQKQGPRTVDAAWYQKFNASRGSEN